MKIPFSFIVVNFRSAHLLPDWFASLSNTLLSPDEYEIIIVNNDASEKELLDTLATQYTFTLIHAKSNLGFGGACNLAAASAQGEIIGFINPDTRFLPGDFHLITKQFTNNPFLGILGLKLLTADGSTQPWSTGVTVTLWDIIRNNLRLPKSKVLWNATAPTSVAWVSGAALFIPRQLFIEVAGFDEHFFLYFEDTDLCMRVNALHKSILYFPSLAIQHLGGQSASSHTQQKKHYYTSQDIFFAKHRPRIEGIFLKILRSFIA